MLLLLLSTVQSVDQSGRFQMTTPERNISDLSSLHPWALHLQLCTIRPEINVAMGGHSAWRKRVANGEPAKGSGGAILRHRPRLGRKGEDLKLNRKGNIGGRPNPKKKATKQRKEDANAVLNTAPRMGRSWFMVYAGCILWLLWWLSWRQGSPTKKIEDRILRSESLKGR